MKLLVGLPFASAAMAGLITFATPPPAAPASQPDDDLGRTLFATQCASCHGTDGRGVEGRGPTLHGEGEAAVDFVLRTGRMPMAAPDMQATPGPVRYSEAEIEALVRYVGAMGEGPPIPDVDAAAGDLGVGGELYRLNCAACHVASGAGAAIGGGREAPALASSTATEVGEAIIVGPGAMPKFDSLTSDDINGIAAYVAELQRQGTTEADDFGGAGPVAEGLSAWLLALLPLIAVTRWIGSPHEGRDAPVEVEDDT